MLKSVNKILVIKEYKINLPLILYGDKGRTCHKY
jgi:hypothetical protein